MTKPKMITRREAWSIAFKYQRGDLWFSVANGYMTAIGLTAINSPDWVLQLLGATAVATSVVFQRGIFVSLRRLEKAGMAHLDERGE